MYLKANPPPQSAAAWDGQSPPIMKLQKGKAVASLKDDEGKVRSKLLKIKINVKFCFLSYSH